MIVAESLMFCGRFYGELGVPPDAQLSVRVTHKGLAGRELASSTADRWVENSKTTEDVAQTEFVAPIGKLETELVHYVQKTTAPMFVLFDFTTFGDAIYEDIVTRFTKGDVS